jgi:halimadienyl-diphosphate synthase
MDVRRRFHHLLGEIGPGLRITRSAYDTAWVARLAEWNEPVGEQALEWIREHQLEDGSWGAGELRYWHDRLICTLAAATALARGGRDQDRPRWQRARSALERAVQGLEDDRAGRTVGFEMLVPMLMAEAEELGIVQRQADGFLGRLARLRQAKLASLPERKINRFVTVGFSTEMVGPEGLHLLDVEDLQEANGSVSYSPAATAFFALHVRRLDPAALEYLERVSGDGAVPYVAPIEVFERAWPLWNLALTGSLDDDLLPLCQPHLDALQEEWKPEKGIASAEGLTLLDGDDTAMTYEVLTCLGRSVDLQAVLHYEADEGFRCYPLEADPSISTNVHILSALRQAGLGVQHPSVHKVLRFLQRTRTAERIWFDKWHASPYYPTAHAVVACAGYADDLVEGAVDWIVHTQNTDGSWGYFMPTAEETAYSLQALACWKRHGGRLPSAPLRQGAAWLADRVEPPYPPLWIGKSLYCPEMVVYSAILSALMLQAQEE